MMEPQTTFGRAGGVSIFTTDGGAHSAADWADVTARLIVTPGANISPDRLRCASELQSKIAADLLDGFQSVRPTSSAAEIDSITRAVVARIAKAAAGSLWEMEFGNAEIAGMIEETVRRNLATHANISLKME